MQLFDCLPNGDPFLGHFVYKSLKMIVTSFLCSKCSRTKGFHGISVKYTLSFIYSPNFYLTRNKPRVKERSKCDESIVCKRCLDILILILEFLG